MKEYVWRIGTWNTNTITITATIAALKTILLAMAHLPEYAHGVAATATIDTMSMNVIHFYRTKNTLTACNFAHTTKQRKDKNSVLWLIEYTSHKARYARRLEMLETMRERNAELAAQLAAKMTAE